MQTFSTWNTPCQFIINVNAQISVRVHLGYILTRGRFSELGAPGKHRNGAIYIAHIYLDQPWGFFFVVMLAAAQWCLIIVSNVSTFFMYVIMGFFHLNYIYSFSRHFYSFHVVDHEIAIDFTIDLPKKLLKLINLTIETF